MCGVHREDCEYGEARVSHQPRGFRIGKRTPGYSIPRPKRNARMAVRFRVFHLFAQSISRSRRTAGAFGSFILSHWSVRPARYGEPSRLLTMPSQPRAQACS